VSFKDDRGGNAVLEQGPCDNDLVSEEHLSVTQDELTSPNPFLQRLMSKMVGLYIWAEVTRTDAARFEQAVDRYLEEIVNHPPRMVLTSGGLLVPA
jgi:hypothetical protein